MKVQGVLPCLPPLLLIISLHTRAEEQGEARGEQDTARIFPLLPPYQSVDFAANFNKLKSSGDAAYFVVRDSTVVSFYIINLTSLLSFNICLLKSVECSGLTPGGR